MHTALDTRPWTTHRERGGPMEITASGAGRGAFTASPGRLTASRVGPGPGRSASLQALDDSDALGARRLHQALDDASGSDAALDPATSPPPSASYGGCTFCTARTSFTSCTACTSCARFLQPVHAVRLVQPARLVYVLYSLYKLYVLYSLYVLCTSCTACTSCVRLVQPVRLVRATSPPRSASTFKKDRTASSRGRVVTCLRGRVI
jgi:hypothetical protein